MVTASDWIVTLVLPHAADALALSALEHQVVDALKGLCGAVTWAELMPGQAADGTVTGVEDSAGCQDALAGLLQSLSVDWAWQPVSPHRRKRLVVSDMDSTLIQGECIDELADVAGIKPLIAAITERAMRGELDFEAALIERVALLKDLPVGAIDTVLRAMEPMPSAATALATMKAQGAYLLLVSGGFTPFTSRVTQALVMDEHRANALALTTDGTALTGQVISPIVGQQAKVDALVEVAARLSLPMEATLAIGDGANDLGMIQTAGMGVAYHAKPKVAAAAPFQIRVGDWRSVLCFQGIAQSQWVVRPDVVVF